MNIINYLFFSMLFFILSLILIVIIRLELLYPNNFFFKINSLKFLQIVIIYNLTMIFVIIFILFSFFSNLLIFYNCISKNFIFLYINIIYFILKPIGYLLLVKIFFLIWGF